MLSVKVLLVVEEMYFEQRDGDGVDGGPLPEARHAPPEIVHFHHKDARKRGRAAKHYIRGGEAEAAAELGAVRHAPADGVRVAEQALRLAKLPGLERGAHRGTRYARALEQDIRHRFEQE